MYLKTQSVAKPARPTTPVPVPVGGSVVLAALRAREGRKSSALTFRRIAFVVGKREGGRAREERREKEGVCRRLRGARQRRVKPARECDTVWVCCSCTYLQVKTRIRGVNKQ